MSQILDHFDALTELGVQVIPLIPNSKRPLCKNWPNNWNARETRLKLVENPQNNIGILLGPVVDVEGDSVAANKKIKRLIGNYAHPCYESTKSTHHLFLNPSNEIKHFRYQEIEFRGWGHQSVLPPSQHEGVRYRWTNNKSFPIPPMPNALLDYYLTKSKKHRKKKLPEGCIKVVCEFCKNQHIIHQKRFDLELKVFFPEIWQCRGCRTLDVRKACRLVRRINRL